MRRATYILGFTMIMAGCATPEEDRARVSTEDGLRLYQQGNFAAAQRDFQTALQFRPGDVDLVYNIGQCYEHQNDWARAEQTYGQCLRQSPDHVACHNALASLLILLTGRTGSSQTPPRSPSASASASASPSAIPAASPQQAMRLVQGFAAARVDGQPVDPFVAAAVASAYEHHTHGLSLYRYSGADIVEAACLRVPRVRGSG